MVSGLVSMFRRALTYQLILAVAVGPLLCCCSAGKSLAGTHQTRSAHQTPTPKTDHAPVERVSHSCCSHKHAPAKSDADHTSPPAKPGQPDGKCPCKEGGDKQAVQVEPAQTAVTTFLRTLAFDAPVLFVFPVVPVTLAVAGLDDSRPTGRLTSPTGEILYAHHNLRC